MAFVWPADVQGSFFMRNTRLPLSIVFVDADGAVVSTSDMEPCPDSVVDCPLYGADGPYRWALEVPQGALPRPRDHRREPPVVGRRLVLNRSISGRAG